MAKDLKFILLLDLYGTQLTARQREIAVCYYHYDLSLKEIAENLGISRQAVMDALKKGGETLVGLEENLGFAALRMREREQIDAALSVIDTDPAAARDILTDLKRKL